MKSISRLKNTPSRLAILSVLREKNCPLDAMQIFELTKDKTDLATVYRALEAFCDNGLATRLEFGEGKCRYEIKGKHHHHLVCEACGKIEDVSTQTIPKLEKEVQKKHKFLVKRHSLEFFGLCQGCQK